MTSHNKLPALFLLLGTFLLSVLSAPAQNELVPNPAAVKLRRIWTQEGKHLTADEYGYAVSGVPDISGDSIRDFAVYQKGNWLFYKGGYPPDTTAFWSVDSADYIAPVAGNFYGGDQQYLLLNRMRIPSVYNLVYIRNLYRIDPTGILTPPVLQFDPETRTPSFYLILSGMTATDIDGNGADDYMMHITGNRRGFGQPLDKDPQVWFYMGGNDFHLDTPTVIIKDIGPGGNNSPDNWEVHFADFDGDGKTDMVMGGSYPTGGPMLRFYWGDDNSPYSWADRPPDRDLQLKSGESGINGIISMGIYDLNGDGAVDIGATIGTGEQAIGRLYLSGKGKDFRSRSFSLQDADWIVNNAVVSSAPIGHLNDSTNRYEMLPLGGLTEQNQIATFGVTATYNGLDHDYEAWYAPGLDGLENESLALRRSPIGDVTNDGYEDVIFANYQYGPIVNTGIAIVLAGGPYIPFDDTTLSVVEYPVAGDAGGLYLWPNPVIDELHIAWKGNLKPMPARFAVYDLNGKEVVAGDVRPHLGAALWRCGSVAAGSYVLVAFDADGKGIATARVVKQ